MSLAVSPKINRVLNLFLENANLEIPGEGNSMGKITNNLGKIEVQSIKTKKIKPGQIYLYCKENNFIAHRAIFSTKKFIYLKGDNNQYLEKVPRENILGQIIYREQFLTKIRFLYEAKLAFIWSKVINKCKQFFK